ncbi:MAG TPA: hypothetical protein ENN25_00475 [Euryarchaeota archaeon]|nr:hypothetical protein [Euryarchaeota archaeon]
MYDQSLTDAEILEIGKREGRIVLTRDRAIAEKGGFLIDDTSLDGQLRVVSDGFHLAFRPDEIRCSLCNGKLLRIDPEEAAMSIPEKSLRSSTEFWRCANCEKIYWNGTHWQSIRDRFLRLHLTEE